MGVEALDSAVLPWASRGDVRGAGPHPMDPLLDRLGDEFGAIAYGEGVR